MPEKTFTIKDLASPDWFDGNQAGSIWITCYRAFRIPEGSIPNGTKILDFGGLRVIFLSGSLKYFDSNTVRIEFKTEKEWRVDGSNCKEQTTPEGIYTIILAPFDKGSIKGNEALTRSKISSYVGLLAAFQGQNLVHHQVFENIFSFPANQSSFFSPVVVNPFSLPAPSISDDSLSIIESANKMILSLEELKQNRALLSLRWFEQAQFELSGIDKFLKNWIAVETIGMPDTSNIRPLIESLAQAYGETPEEIKKKYKIARLLDLRSRIVHNGLIIAVHSLLSTYVEALYVDALYVFLGLKSERRLERIINTPGFDVMAYLPK